MEVLQSVSRAKLTQIETLIREEVFDKEVLVILFYIYTFLTCVLSLDNRNIVLGSLSDSTFLDVLTSKLQYSFLVSNAFIKKALDWPTLKPGDSKALDEFSLFLIECKNAAVSIDAMRILENFHK
jgi:hypothetical protein